MKKSFFILLIISANVLAQSIPSKNWRLFDRGNSPLSSNRIESIHTNTAYEYWLVTGRERIDAINFFDGALQRFYRGHWKLFDNSNSPLEVNMVQDLAETSEGKLLIATSRGLYIKASNAWDSLNTGNSPLPDNFIYRISVDRLNRYWLGIPNFGIAVYANGAWTVYNAQNSFPGIGDFNFIASDSAGHVWVGTDFFGLYSFDGTHWVNRIKGLFTGGQWQPIVGLAIDSRGQKWVAMNQQGGGGKIAKSSDDVSFVYFDSAAIGFSFSLLSYDGVVSDKRDVKYFGTTDGLLRYDNVGWTKLDTSNSPLPANWFRVGHVDASNNKIFGLSSFMPTKSDHGLIFYNEDSVVVTTVENGDSETPRGYVLYQNYPNPFNPLTKIKYSIPNAEIVQIKIYDLQGKEMKILFAGYKSRGNHEIELDANGFPSGVYFYRMISRNYTDTKKMVVLR